MSAPAIAETILHVEDQEAVRYTVGRVLKQAGFAVEEASTGEEALLLARRSPDLVLLDVRLPDIDGREVCRRLKSDPETASIPVLHLTGTYGSGIHQAAALEAGADGYLTHPVEPIVLVATVRALLRARRAEAQIVRLLELEQAARTEAERANRLKDEFLATLSHELRTPLNAILGWSHLLRAREPDPATLARALESIERNARSQSQLISDILDVSRIVTGKLLLNVSSVDVGAVITAAVESARPSIDAKGLTLDLRLDPAAGPVRGDADRLQQVVWNLLSNAVKFTPKGGRIELCLQRAASGVEIGVEDTGIGIDAELLPHVFERFRQGDASTTRTHSGLGLGLAIVRHLLELHGGTVRAESPGRGRGATFTVWLPYAALRDLEAVAPASIAEAPPEAADLATAPRLDGLRVLVVDDEEDTRDLLATALAGAGAEVRTAASACEARDAFRQSPPEVLLSDIGLPGEDGLSLLRSIRALPAESGGAVPAIALSGYAGPQDRERALAAGFQAHLTKPVELHQLLTLIADSRPVGG